MSFFSLTGAGVALRLGMGDLLLVMRMSSRYGVNFLRNNMTDGRWQDRQS